MSSERPGKKAGDLMPYYTKEQLARAREMDLLTYLRRNDPGELVHVSGSEYCTREHDSLKISNGKWMWFSRGFGGVTALDYLIRVKQIPFIALGILVELMSVGLFIFLIVIIPQIDLIAILLLCVPFITFVGGIFVIHGTKWLNYLQYTTGQASIVEIKPFYEVFKVQIKRLKHWVLKALDRSGS